MSASSFFINTAPAVFFMQGERLALHHLNERSEFFFEHLIQLNEARQVGSLLVSPLPHEERLSPLMKPDCVGYEACAVGAK